MGPCPRRIADFCAPTVPALLGEFVYKKLNSVVDCTRTIFILTTNAADAAIMQYCSDQQKFHKLQVACTHPDLLIDEMAELDSMVSAALQARFKVRIWLFYKGNQYAVGVAVYPAALFPCLCFTIGQVACKSSYCHCL